MKKLKYLLFVLLLVPCVVKADMAGPDARPYEMIVTNPDGIKYYENDESSSPEGTLKKDEKFTVIYEYNGIYNIELNDKSYTLKSLDGAVLVKDVVDPTKDKDEYIKRASNKEALVYAEDGVDILEGPASTYKKVGHIAKDVKIKYNYYIGVSENDITHIYVDYNGKKGWVEILGKKVLLAKTQDYITKGEYKISGATIPKNKVVRSYYQADAWSRSALIEYNNCIDLVNTGDRTSNLLAVYKEYATSKKEFKVYTEADNKGALVTTIPSNTKFLVIASYSLMGEDEVDLYVEYQGKRGWVEAPSWEDYERDTTTVENENILSTEKASNKEEKEELVEDVVPVPDKKEKAKKTSNKKPEDYTLMYVIIGASVAVAALVVIILVNKKSKKKKSSLEEDSQVISNNQNTEIEETTNKTE